MLKSWPWHLSLKFSEILKILPTSLLDWQNLIPGILRWTYGSKTAFLLYLILWPWFFILKGILTPRMSCNMHSDRLMGQKVHFCPYVFLPWLWLSVIDSLRERCNKSMMWSIDVLGICHRLITGSTAVWAKCPQIRWMLCVLQFGGGWSPILCHLFLSPALES